MMKKAFLISFLFLFFVALGSPAVSSAVSGLGQIPNFNLKDDFAIGFTASQYFSGFDELNISWVSQGCDFHQGSIFTDFGGGDVSNDDSCMKFEIIDQTTDLQANMYSLGNGSFNLVNITASNSSDSSWYAYWFYVYTGFDAPASWYTDTITTKVINGNESAIWWLGDYLINFNDLNVQYYYNNSWSEIQTYYYTSNLCDITPDFTICVNQATATINITGTGQNFDMVFSVNANSYTYPDVYAGAKGLRVYFTSDLPDRFLNDSYAPTLTDVFEGFDLGPTEQDAEWINNFASDFQFVTLQYYDTHLNNTVSLYSQIGGDGGSSCSIGIITACLTSVQNAISMTVTSNGHDFSANANLSIQNSFGGTLVTFPILTKGNLSVSDESDLADSSSFFSYLTSLFSRLFPDEDTLSTKYKFGFVFVTMFTLTGILLFAFYNMNGISQGAVTVIMILNILLIFWFVAIQYIPTVFVIFTAVLIIGGVFIKRVGVV